jgi:hypothetical protein
MWTFQAQTDVDVFVRGDDDNVPVWHGRESYSVVKTWTRIHGIAPNITYVVFVSCN